MIYFCRQEEEAQLRKFSSSGKAGIVVVYGRRRVGKTTLIEHVFSADRLVKIEGVYGEPPEFQLANFVKTFRKRFNEPLLASAAPETWLDAFELLWPLVKEGPWVVYLEELQWMANYSHEIIAHFKSAWDNYFQKNPELIVVLCGSSPSFFQTHVVRSQALYNRSTLTIHLEPFSIAEARHFLPKKSVRSLFDAYLTVGGIPQYLEKLDDDASVIQALCQSTFRKEAYFVTEFDKIFVSSFAHNKNYRTIVEYIASHGATTRNEILSGLKKESGGLLSEMLLDLELSGFIERLRPLRLSPPASKLGKYAMKDAYMHFYFHFIRPQMQNIQKNVFRITPSGGLDMRAYQSWLGFAFERFCRANPVLIAGLLGFSGVRYECGPLYSRKQSGRGAGYQIDLAFKRADKVLTLCEIKYLDKPVGSEVIEEFETKLERAGISQEKTIQRILISASGVSPALYERGYFDRVLGLEDLLREEERGREL